MAIKRIPFPRHAFKAKPFWFGDGDSCRLLIDKSGVCCIGVEFARVRETSDSGLCS